jgi:membrane protease subunit HflK
MVDAKGSGNLLYLPLDKLMAATAAIAPTVSADGQPSRASGGAATNPYEGAVPPQVEKVPPVTGGYSSRDGIRNRERGDR